MPDRVPWEELGPEFYKAWGYPRGEFEPEHVEILGPTGSGKSYFQKTILMERARLRGSHVVILATKPADKTLMSMGWPIVNDWPPKKQWGDKRSMDQVIFWAKAPTLGKAGQAVQKRQVEHLLEELWVPESNVILSFDEIGYVIMDLGLQVEISRYYREARGLGITLVANAQRAPGSSRYMHSESVWSVLFTPKDEDDLERVAEVAGDKRYYRTVLPKLSRTKREFLLIHNLTNERYISHIPKGPSLATKKVGGETPRKVHVE